MDDSEVYGRAADTSVSMTEFRNCIRDSGLEQLPFTGCPFTWHNCSEGPRSLWKRLDRMLANANWMDTWPHSSYISALPSTSDHSPLILNSMDRQSASYPVTLSEVKEAFFDIDVESAPGPDGYTSAFYRNAWPVLGQTLFRAVDEFLPNRYVSDYRPIACCNVLYKSITKIIVKRLQQVLPLLIDYSQNAFVPGRSIIDNILLAQELLAASFSVSLNGSIHGFFKGGRGLRQGDPMSPYLFVLVMEIWNLLLKFRIKEATDFQYHWKCKDIGLINLCFADDVLLFCKAHLPSIIVISDALNEFAALSGLKINPAKSQIIFSRAVQQERQDPRLLGVSRRLPSC
ncbi:UNVERIFIED_CONTAM: hypothetical protein Sangu_2990100 [Sesamum angustifolium]|uniref:Reverse transcriptase domain-containing protein n=1 Tax=Sesamum angustifolium TaxID=2727405 RepID=A0AAW2KQ70_9LAMI